MKRALMDTMNWKLFAAFLSVMTFVGGLIAGAWALDDRIRVIAVQELTPLREDVGEIKHDVKTIRDVLLIRNGWMPQ